MSLKVNEITDATGLAAPSFPNGAKATSIQSDSITNQAGTGAPNFPNGFNISGNGLRWQRKTLGSDPITTGDYIQFNNLTIGRTYRASGYIRLDKTAGGSAQLYALVEIRDNTGGTGNVLVSSETNINLSSGTFAAGATTSTSYSGIFIATTTIAVFRVSAIGGSATRVRSDCSLQIEELPLHTQTTAWT